MKLWTRCAATILGAATVCMATGSHAACYVITSQGQRIEGTEIRAKSTGEIVLRTAAGTQSFFPGQYTKAVADKPPEIDQAARLVESKQYDEAIKQLEDVAVKYKFLEWDSQALALLPAVYAKKGDAAGAIGAYEKLFSASPKTKDEPEVQWDYRQALLDGKQYDKLEPVLTDVIANGSRSDAAHAQIMRGDIKSAQGQMEGAVLDYLRTVVLFANEKSSQPEAMFKAAEALKALRDPRAGEFYKKLVEEYPGSPYAEKAKSVK